MSKWADRARELIWEHDDQVACMYILAGEMTKHTLIPHGPCLQQAQTIIDRAIANGAEYGG